MLKLAQEIINGRKITREDDLNIFLNCDLKELCEGANKIREHFVGNFVDVCTIINAKSGGCSENCKFCAQSIYSNSSCEVYGFLPLEKILNACKNSEKNNAHRFCIVTAAKALTGKEFDEAVFAISVLKKECDIKLCASMGFLTKSQLKELHKAGVTTYHHNIETSKRFFPNICTTHSYDMKINTIKAIKEEGLRVCSGGIFGMGETFHDRLDMAISLAELEVDSIPINILMPIKGTALENLKILSEEDLLRTIAFFRYINPKAEIRLAGGRCFLSDFGEKTFNVGASAVVAGNMLTTKISTTINNDFNMLKKMGRKI